MTYRLAFSLGGDLDLERDRDLDRDLEAGFASGARSENPMYKSSRTIASSRTILSRKALEYPLKKQTTFSGCVHGLRTEICAHHHPKVTEIWTSGTTFQSRAFPTTRTAQTTFEISDAIPNYTASPLVVRPAGESRSGTSDLQGDGQEELYNTRCILLRDEWHCSF